MTRYRPIPQTVDAWRFDGTIQSVPIAVRCKKEKAWASVGEVVYAPGPAPDRGQLAVGTTTYVRIASAGDWIVRYQNGDLLHMKHEAFMAAYEPEPAHIVEEAMAGMRASLREAGSAKMIYHGQPGVEDARNAALEEAALMAEETAACGAFLADDIRALKTEKADVEDDGFVTIHPIP